MTKRPDISPLTPASARVKKVAALSGRSSRSKEGKFRLEGPQAVRSLLEYRPESALEVYLTEQAGDQHPELEALAHTAGVDLTWVEPAVIEAMVREQGVQSVAHPQGVIAVARPCDLDWRDALDALPEEGPVTLVVCERLQDPGNAGVVMRTADAAGAHAVFFGTESTDIFAPKVVRASVGSLLTVPVARKVPLAELIEDLRRRGIAVAATSPYGSTDLFEWDVPERVAWIMGNEGQGLSDTVLEAADARVRIPLFGRAESLNLATAATLCVFESARRHGGTR